MGYYEILVSSSLFHGNEPLTYSSETALVVGNLVVVPLRSRSVVGVVVKEVPTPKFACKSVLSVITEQTVPPQSLELLNWLRAYYPAPLGSLAQLFLPDTLARKHEAPSPPKIPAKIAKLPALTVEQQEALFALQVSPTTTALLHGDTGTGKTRLYIELARDNLDNGRSVMLLTPEIGLTPQLEKRVRESLPYPVVTIHSNLAGVARRNIWLQILQAKTPLVVMGPRSTLFTPIHNLGLIVMDEAHDAAYKQEQTPYYQSRQVAAELAKLHKAKLVLGTATPLISDYFLAEAKKAPIIRLTDQPAGRPERHIITVNIRDRAEFPHQPHLSKPMLQHIETALAKQQQSLVFLNRRGTARVVLCQVCGWQALCPRCDLPLTFHADHHQIRCHTCGYHATAPSSCPTCHSADIIFKSIGTKAIAEELKQAFPNARIQRFDTDNLKTERLEDHYEALAKGEIDILVGTQLLTKGLDLLKLAVVGVVNADTGLNFPDYTAQERNFALMTQVIGRVGRGHLPGTVVIQSYNPDNAALQAAVTADWATFYKTQLEERKNFGFPPFYHLLKLSCSRASSSAASQAAHKLTKLLQEAGLKIALSGPAPSFYEKVSGKYRWQLVVKAKDRRELIKAVALLPANWSYDLDPADLL
jgi:primosomal protein N' (replication factor Y)